MYPLHLEHQYQKFFVGCFDSIAREVNRQVLRELDNAGIAHDGGEVVRLDADIISFIRDLRDKYGNRIPSRTMTKEVRKNFRLLNQWSRDKTTEAIHTILSRLTSPQGPAVTGRPSPSGKDGELWMTTVNLQKADALTDEIIDATVTRNLSLIKQIGTDHLDGLTDIMKDSLLQGDSIKTVKDKIRHSTGVHHNKAKFWARDQASKFFGEVNKTRQTTAGIPGYIWRTASDGGVRDSHYMLEGTYHPWNSPPKIWRAGKHGGGIVRLHPGEDYNCRCWAEPALSEADADREYIEGRVLPEGAPKKSGTGENSISDRMIINIFDKELRENFNKALGIYDGVLNIDTSGIRNPLKVMKMTVNDPYLQRAAGYYSPGESILALNPRTSTSLTTSIHEMAHWIDHVLLGQGMNMGSKTSDLLKDFRDTVSGSKTYKRLKEINESKLFVDSKGVSYYIYKQGKRILHIPKSNIEYFLQTPELFARAMEQYMASESDDIGLKEQFKLKRSDAQSKLGFHKYWSDTDFKTIKHSLKQLFKGLGWLK